MRSIDIPTAISKREAEVIQSIVRGKRVVEFGALLGYSTVLMGRIANVTSIDRHEGYGPSTLRSFLSNLDRFSVPQNVVVVAKPLEEVSPLRADVGFIDLDGSVNTTCMAIHRCDTPTILIHDLGRCLCDGVEEAIRKAGLYVAAMVDTLAVCKRRI